MTVYRRRSVIRHIGDAVHVDVEDYQHRFGLVLYHDGKAITAVEGRPLRTPWAICPGATSMLDRFVGLALAPSPFEMMRKVELAQQCTHMADMACLAASASARGCADRTYDIAISLTAISEEDSRTLDIARDGVPQFSWAIANGVITAPENLAGLETFRAARWAESHAATADDVEAIFVAHRTVMVANGLRYPDIEIFSHAADSKVGRNACYSMQDVRVADASRNIGSVRLFATSEDLLTDLPGQGRA